MLFFVVSELESPGGEVRNDSTVMSVRTARSYGTKARTVAFELAGSNDSAAVAIDNVDARTADSTSGEAKCGKTGPNNDCALMLAGCPASVDVTLQVRVRSAVRYLGGENLQRAIGRLRLQ